jgi:hypothetical protein
VTLHGGKPYTIAPIVIALSTEDTAVRIASLHAAMKTRTCPVHMTATVAVSSTVITPATPMLFGAPALPKILLSQEFNPPSSQNELDTIYNERKTAASTRDTMP